MYPNYLVKKTIVGFYGQKYKRIFQQTIQLLSCVADCLALSNAAETSGGM